jgi:hypothetical protein
MEKEGEQNFWKNIEKLGEVFLSNRIYNILNRQYNKSKRFDESAYTKGKGERKRPNPT